MNLLTAWELAAREFEPARHLWAVGAWRATVEAGDRLRVDGPTTALGITLPGVDLTWLRPDATPTGTTAPPADREAVYAPRGSARDILAAQDSEALAAGPAGTGKSLASLWRVHLMALLYPGLRALIVRKTLTSLGSTGLVTFREQVIPEARPAGVVRWYGGSQSRAAAWLYANGSEIGVGGMDRAEKIMSSEYDLVFVQEATELAVGDWEAITSRLRHGVAPYQQLIADCNPAHPQHWLKRRADAGTTRLIHCRHEDNPALFDDTGKVTARGAAYLGRLDRLTGVRYQRLRKGRWVAAEGVIYEEFDEAIHLADRPDPLDPDASKATCLPPDWVRWWAVDFGYSNPFVCQCWAEDPDGRLWLEWEIYYTRRLVEEHAATILDQVTTPIDGYIHPAGEKRRAYHGRDWTGPRPRAIICDHDAEGRATLAAELGLSTKPAKKAVVEGIQAVQSRLRPAGDGLPRLVLLRDTLVERDPELVEAGLPTCTVEELPGYVWATGAGKRPKEEPVKENDHGCFIAGTMVDTPSGAIPIETVRPGDLVITRSGPRAVVASGMTDPFATVYVLKLSDGRSLTGTGNHPIWVNGIGWRPLASLRYADRLTSCRSWMSSNSTASSIADTLSQIACAPETTTPQASLTVDAAAKTSTSSSGSTSTTKTYLPDATSTTLTATRSTTTPTTWSASPRPSTSKLTERTEGLAPALQSSWPTWPGSAPSPANGTSQMKAGGTTGSKRSLTGSATAQLSRESANSAESATRQLRSSRVSASAPTTARANTGAEAESTTRHEHVPSVEGSSPSTSTPESNAADVHVLSVCELDTPRPVFNLTVADDPEYFANGVLVHNCDPLRYVVAERDLGGRPNIRIL